MRTTFFSLLILSATAAFASPASFTVSILSSRDACTQGINRAQVVTDAGSGAKVHWTIANGVIVDGANAPAVSFTPLDGGLTVLTVSVEWSGLTVTQHVTLPVFDPPAIVRQPRSATVPPGGSTTLTVDAINDAFVYDWFEGAPGDTSKVVAADTTVFTTPPLTKSTSYWVRVSGRCGAVVSRAAIVTVGAKRRSAGR